jgi:uncharacterized membrane protein (DUF373 family)
MKDAPVKEASVKRDWEAARAVLNYMPGLPPNPRSLTTEQRRDVANALRDHGWTWRDVRACLRLSHQEARITSWSRKAEMTQVGETAIFLFVIVVLLVVVWVICQGAWSTLWATDRLPVQLVAARLLGDALLIVIVVEIIETVRQQLRAVERIRHKLVRDVLLVGIVAAVRHLLYVGAVLSLVQSNSGAQPVRLLPVGVSRGELVLELGVSCAVVLALVVCWVLVDHQVQRVRAFQEPPAADSHLVLASSGTSAPLLVNVPAARTPQGLVGDPSGATDRPTRRGS